MESGVVEIIATGHFDFPIISQEGNVIIVGEYNYANFTMNYYAFGLAKDNISSTLIENGAIGPLRISAMGKYYSYISAEHLILGKLAATIQIE